MSKAVQPKAQTKKLKNNPMHSSQPFVRKTNFEFYEIPLTRRAKQGYAAIIQRSELSCSTWQRTGGRRRAASFVGAG